MPAWPPVTLDTLKYTSPEIPKFGVDPTVGLVKPYVACGGRLQLNVEESESVNTYLDPDTSVGLGIVCGKDIPLIVNPLVFVVPDTSNV